MLPLVQSAGGPKPPAQGDITMPRRNPAPSSIDPDFWQHEGEAVAERLAPLLVSESKANRARCIRQLIMGFLGKGLDRLDDPEAVVAEMAAKRQESGWLGEMPAPAPRDN